jgi:hypothetical protein
MNVSGLVQSHSQVCSENSLDLGRSKVLALGMGHFCGRASQGPQSSLAKKRDAFNERDSSQMKYPKACSLHISSCLLPPAFTFHSMSST